VSHDTNIHRIVRPAVRLVATTGVTPNHLTTLRLITGLAAAAAFALGDAVWFDIGGAVFLLSTLLDRADGELARQTGRTSTAGHRYDLICDCIATAAAFIGIGFGLVGSLGPSAALLGLAAGAGVGGLFWLLNVLRLARSCTYAFWGGRIIVDADDAMIFLPVLIWCGAAELELIAATVITLAAVLGLSLRSFHRRRRSGIGEPELSGPECNPERASESTDGLLERGAP
jgi:phosphatidylglycerophosphate synthase